MSKDKIKKRQKLMLFALVAPIVLIAVILGLYIFPEESKPKKSSSKNIALPTDDINPQESWNVKTDDQIALLDQKLGFIENLLIQSKENEAKVLKEKADLVSKINALEKKIKDKEKHTVAIQEAPQETPFSEGRVVYNDPEPFPTYFKEERRGLVIQKAEFSRELVKNVDSTIPAGTTVKAVLVSSVDAPCGAYSSTDPQPVKLQILDDGHLPKCVRAKLKGGVIIASAYGDLSSERLIVRVERLTQIKPSGDFVETTVTGFVTGEDGKLGVRGSIVDRSASLVKNAAVSGFFSGANSFFQAYAASRWAPCGWLGCGSGYCGDCDDNCDSRDFAYGLASQGGTEGIGNAFDTLTDYYIRRAELIKPVIQVNAGRIVDITFTIGTEIGDIHAKEKCEKVRTNTRSSSV